LSEISRFFLSKLSIQLQALSYAAAANKPDTIKILLKHNADISLVGKYNISAKDIADAKGFKKVIDISY
jgi:hypothetical protein